MQNIRFFCLLLLPLIGQSTIVDKTTTINEIGLDVTDAVILKIRRLAIFPDDFNYLRRLAYVETVFGSVNLQDGGIWNLKAAVFDTTKNVPTEISDRIFSEFGIVWADLVHSDCRKPLISGLAVSIVVQLNGGSNIHAEIQHPLNQASFLATHALTPSYATYMQKSMALEESLKCNSPIDVSIALGGSAIRGQAFEYATSRELNFAKRLVAYFNRGSGRGRFGMISMNSQNQAPVRIHLDDNFNLSDLQNLIGTTEHVNSSTDTSMNFVNDQIESAVQMFETAVIRRGIPKVLIIFSNREAAEDIDNINQARDAGIKTYSVSLGIPLAASIHEQQLEQLAQGSSRNIFPIYTPLVDGGWQAGGIEYFELRLIPQLCALHHTLEVDPLDWWKDTLESTEVRFFVIPVIDSVPQYFIRLTTDGAADTIHAVLSHTELYPSSAMYDLELFVGEQQVPLDEDATTGQLYIRVTNNGDTAIQYTLNVATTEYVETTTTTTTTTTDSTTSTEYVPTTTTEKVQTAFDNTMIENAIGLDVTDAVILKIRRLGLFPDDFNYLRRLAYIETLYGNNLLEDGGIWNLKADVFETTKNVPTEISDRIFSEFRIVWADLVHNDCLKPLISGLAVSIVVQLSLSQGPSMYGPIQSLIEQSQFLPTIGLTTADPETYRSKSSNLESSLRCNRQIDFTLALGGSAIRDATNFVSTTPKELNFAKKMVGYFDRTSSRFGLVALNENNEVEVRIRLNSTLSIEQIQGLIETTHIPSINTDTTVVNDQIQSAVQMYENGGVRKGVPKVLVIFSNRESSEGIENINQATNAGIKTYSISVGIPDSGSTHEQQLKSLAQGSSLNVFPTYDSFIDPPQTYTAGLENLELRLIPQLCALHHTLGVDDGEWVDRLDKDEVRFFVVPVVHEISNYFLSLTTDDVSDELVVSLSYSQIYPSTAIYDLEFGVGFHSIPLDVNNQMLYLRVQNGGPALEFSVMVTSSEEDDTTTTSGAVETTSTGSTVSQPSGSSTTPNPVTTTTPSGANSIFVWTWISLLMGMASLFS